MALRIVPAEYTSLGSAMSDRINQSERVKNIQIMLKTQERLMGDLESDGWLTIKDFTLIYNSTIKNLKDFDYITKNRICALPTDKEFVKMLAEDIAIFMRETTEYVWDATPDLKERGSKNVEEMNEFVTHLLKRPELCNTPSSQMKRDKHNRVGLLSESGNISDPTQKIFEAVKKYYEENLEGVRIPIRDLLIIRDTIELTWEVDSSFNKKPSRLRYEA